MQQTIHFFVTPAGQTVPASETDQPFSKLRVRTVEDGRTVVVSAGLWYPNQTGYRPFKMAVEEARREAKRLQERMERGAFSIQRGRFTPKDMSRLLREYREDKDRRRPIGDPTMEALHKHLSYGVPLERVAREYVLFKDGHPPEQVRHLAGRPVFRDLGPEYQRRQQNAARALTRTRDAFLRWVEERV